MCIVTTSIIKLALAAQLKDEKKVEELAKKKVDRKFVSDLRKTFHELGYECAAGMVLVKYDLV